MSILDFMSHFIFTKCFILDGESVDCVIAHEQAVEVKWGNMSPLCTQYDNFLCSYIFYYFFLMYVTHRPLGTIHCCSGAFTAEEVGATQWAPGRKGPAGECVGQPENGEQRQGQTWSNPRTRRQREQNTRLAWFPLSVHRGSATFIWKSDLYM